MAVSTNLSRLAALPIPSHGVDPPIAVGVEPARTLARIERLLVALAEHIDGMFILSYGRKLDLDFSRTKVVQGQQSRVPPLILNG